MSSEQDSTRTSHASQHCDSAVEAWEPLERAILDLEGDIDFPAEVQVELTVIPDG